MMPNILVDSIALLDFAVYNTTGKGRGAEVLQKLRDDQAAGQFHNFITSELCIINATNLLSQHSDRHQLTAKDDRRLRKEFEAVVEPYFTQYKEKYSIYRVGSLREMMAIGDMEMELPGGYSVEEHLLVYLATRTYQGANILGYHSHAYQKMELPMYYAYS